MLITLIISFEKHGNNMEHCTCLKSKLSLSVMSHTLLLHNTNGFFFAVSSDVCKRFLPKLQSVNMLWCTQVLCHHNLRCEAKLWRSMSSYSHQFMWY